MFEHPPCTVSHLSIRESICRNTNSCDNFTILNGERFDVISIVEFKSHAGNNIYTCICCKVISFKYKSFCGIYIYIALYEFTENSICECYLIGIILESEFASSKSSCFGNFTGDLATCLLVIHVDC